MSPPHVPPMSPCLLRSTRLFDLEQVVNPGRKVFSQQSGGSDDDRHFSSGDDDHFSPECPVHTFLSGLYGGDLFSRDGDAGVAVKGGIGRSRAEAGDLYGGSGPAKLFVDRFCQSDYVIFGGVVA